MANTRDHSRRAAAALSPDRDPRIDFARGMAILIIYTDHLPPNLFSRFTPQNLGFSDMADVFVFLSGYVCGLTYGRTLARHGFLRCQRKACIRIVQIAVSYIVTLAILSVGMSALVHAGVIPFFGAHAFHKPLLVQMAAMHRTGVVGILPLYCCLLMVLPTMLWLRRIRESAMLAASIALYGLVQFAPGMIERYTSWQAISGYNPFGWQLIFFIGVALSGTRRWKRCTLDKWYVTLLAIAALEAALLITLFHGRGSLPLVDKVSLGPLRVTHLGAVIVLARLLLPRKDAPRWKNRCLLPIIICGQNSLISYCTGSCLAFVGSKIAVDWGFEWRHQIMWNVLGWGASILSAWIWMKLKRWQTTPHEPSNGQEIRQSREVL